MTTVWIDASSGASGDMLLGALAGAGVRLDVMQSAVSAVAPEPVELGVSQVRRRGFAATRCHVEVADSIQHRTWSDVHTLLELAALDAAVAELATAVFQRLAEAEAAVHGTSPAEVHFHEVGALDAIADVVGVCAGFVELAADRVVVSPVAVGSGTVDAAHGTLSVPPPAVAELLRGVPTYAGPGTSELCTPTGAALLTTLADAYGPLPALVTRAIGVGAGGRDPETHANVLRLFVGDRVGLDTASLVPRESGSTTGTELVIEANVDDLDPRVWPGVLDALLSAGAADAWLSPITMKKGRPAYTLHALTPPETADAVRRAIFTETSTIGVREHLVAKQALAREFDAVEVHGHRIAVKIAYLDGAVVNVSPEWDDVARAADDLGRPAADVLAAAVTAAYAHRPLTES